MVVISHRGNFRKIEKFLKGAKSINFRNLLDAYGMQGVAALAQATPIDEGLTAKSWDYEIFEGKGTMSINWTNSNVVDGIPVAILIQYGHATRDGSYIQGIDFINPAIRPIFEKISEDLWREVTSK